MHLSKVKRLSIDFLKTIEGIYGYSKFHECSPYLEFEPYLFSKYTGEDSTEAEYNFTDNSIILYYRLIEDEKHLAETLIHEYQHYLQSPSWFTRYYNMGYDYSDHPYEVAAFKEESNWRAVA
jgi:hypothetical protein